MDPFAQAQLHEDVLPKHRPLGSYLRMGKHPGMGDECQDGSLKGMLGHAAGRTGAQAAVANHPAAVAGTAALFVFDMKEKGLVRGEIPGEHAGPVALAQGGGQGFGKGCTMAACEGGEIGLGAGVQLCIVVHEMSIV